MIFSSRGLDPCCLCVWDECVSTDLGAHCGERVSEHRTDERAAKHQGWSMALQPARLTEANGVSDGTGVAVRSHIGHGKPQHFLWHEDLDSRVHISWVGAFCKGGFYLISLYLHHTEGLSRRNLDILQHLAWVIKGLHGPWLIAADWNMTPAMLRSSGWLTLVDGAL